MDDQNPTRDINGKNIFKLKKLIAPVLKAVLPEFKDVSIDEIVDIYLRNPEDPDNDQVTLLNTEYGGFNELQTRKDLLFKVRTPFDYNLIIDIEIFTTTGNLPTEFRLRVYMAEEFTSQYYKVKELKEEGKQDSVYSNLDKPVQIDLFTNPPESRKDKIILIQPVPSIVEVTDGNIEEPKIIGEIEPLEIEKKSYNFERIYKIYVDLEDVTNKKGIFKYLAEGTFSLRNSKEERLKIIEEFTGPLKEETKMDLAQEFGTKEFYREYGRREGRQEGRQESKQEDINTLTNYLIENENLSYQKANQKAKIILKVNIDN